MAKKKTSRATKKAGKKSAAKRTVRKNAAPPRLSAAERAALLKPGEDLDEIIEDLIEAWLVVGGKVKVAGLTRARLASLARKASRAEEKERVLVAKQAAKLAPLTDARMRAKDEAYREALKLKRIADAIAETDPAVAEAFAAVNERFRRVTRSAPAAG